MDRRAPDGSTINGFPITCPRAESLLAAERIETHAPVAVVNRFDLAPMNGANCGEYRIIYALGASEEAERLQAASSSSAVQTGRNFLIFEGVLPNPDPECGIAACAPVAEFWHSLTTEPLATTRADRIEEFYFDGICDFEPVIAPDHYGQSCLPGGDPTGCGQIRTNQFIDERWLLRQFWLQQDCSGSACELEVDPVAVRANPHTSLWSSTSALFTSFETDFLGQLGELLPVPDQVFWIASDTDFTFDAGESAVVAGTTGNDYVPDTTFAADITLSLGGFPPSITATEVAERATSQSCAGCHEFSSNDDLGNTLGTNPNIVWPSSLGFVHVDETSALSPALLDFFLPFRQQVTDTFLAAMSGEECGEGTALVRVPGGPDLRAPAFRLVPTDEAPVDGASDTLGGSRSH